jgi:hypothetical protein
MDLLKLGEWFTCPALISTDISYRLDIMASTSSNLERGYEKIFRWCSHEFRQTGRDLHLEVSVIMRESVSRLRKRPELLTYAFPRPFSCYFG